MKKFFSKLKRKVFPLMGGLRWAFYAFLVLSCNSEDAPDCLQNAGDLIRVQTPVDEFSTITVFENLNLVVKQGDQQTVEIESGEFLINEISATVEDGRLLLRNENGCNIFREYGLSTVYVTSPNLSQIRSSTGGLISSDGPLRYPSLSLVSESFNQPEADTNDGSFEIELQNERVTILVNGLAYIELNGTTNNLSINVAAGDSRIEAAQLIADNVSLNHRGTNDVIVHPLENISGIIRGYGDVISVRRPAIVEVEELFNGRLIFRE